MISKKGCIFSLLVLFILGLSIPLFTPNLKKVRAAGMPEDGGNPTTTTTTTPTTTTTTDSGTINEYASDNWNGIYYLNECIYATDSALVLNCNYSDNAIHPFIYYFIDNVTAKSLVLMNYQCINSSYIENNTSLIGYIGFMPCNNPSYLLDNYDEDKMNSFVDTNALLYGVEADSQGGLIIDLEDKTYTGLLILSFVEDYFNEYITDDTTMWPIPFFSNIEIDSLTDEETDYLIRYNYDFGYSNGYDDGSNQGYDSGYADGYREALEQSDNDLSKYNNVLRIAWSGASTFLNTQVFGRLTILHLILLPLTLGVLLIIIKLIRG